MKEFINAVDHLVRLHCESFTTPDEWTQAVDKVVELMPKEEPLDLSNPDKIPYDELPNNIREAMNKLGQDEIEVFNRFRQTWITNKWISKDRYIGIYRKKQPKPEPTYTEWTMEDVPMPVCWIKSSFGPSLIIDIQPNGVLFTHGTFLSYPNLRKHYKYSIDGINWQPCRKEVV